MLKKEWFAAGACDIDFGGSAVCLVDLWNSWLETPI